MKALLKKLIKFQEVCPPITKDSVNPFFKSSYAGMDHIQAHIKPHLITCGLVLVQRNIILDGALYVESTIKDADTAEYELSLFPVVANKQDPQAYGSALSYAKRYSVTGLLNLIIQDAGDDDGNKASGKDEKSAKVETPTTLPTLNESNPLWKAICEAVVKGERTIPQLKTKFLIDKKTEQILSLLNKTS